MVDKNVDGRLRSLVGASLYFMLQAPFRNVVYTPLRIFFFAVAPVVYEHINLLRRQKFTYKRINNNEKFQVERQMQKYGNNNNTQ